MSGSIPPELSNLESLALRTNELTGSIPPELGDLSDLETLSLRENQLMGAIPAELGQLADLRSLTLSDNQLSGSIPSELGDLADNLQLIAISGNQLSGCIRGGASGTFQGNDFDELDPPLMFCGTDGEMSDGSPSMQTSENEMNYLPVKDFQPVSEVRNYLKTCRRIRAARQRWPPLPRWRGLR